MERRYRRSSWRLAAAGCAVAILLAVTTIVALGRPLASTAGNMPIRAVYLADPLAPALDGPTARGRGIQLVTTLNDLLSVAANTEVDAILLDRGAFDLVGDDWLAGQLRRGRVIVGFNIPPGRFSQLPGADPGVDSGGMRADGGGMPFYSLAYQLERDGRVTNAGLDSDAIYSSNVFLDRLSRKIEGVERARAAAEQRGMPTGPTRSVR